MLEVGFKSRNGCRLQSVNDIDSNDMRFRVSGYVTYVFQGNILVYVGLLTVFLLICYIRLNRESYPITITAKNKIHCIDPMCCLVLTATWARYHLALHLVCYLFFIYAAMEEAKKQRSCS